jgi:hypothetical protein
MHLKTSITLSAPFNTTEAQLQAHLATHSVRSAVVSGRRLMAAQLPASLDRHSRRYAGVSVRSWWQPQNRRRLGSGQPGLLVRRRSNPTLAAIAAAMLRANQP